MRADNTVVGRRVALGDGRERHRAVAGRRSREVHAASVGIDVVGSIVVARGVAVAADPVGLVARLVSLVKERARDVLAVAVARRRRRRRSELGGDVSLMMSMGTRSIKAHLFAMVQGDQGGRALQVPLAVIFGQAARGGRLAVAAAGRGDQTIVGDDFRIVVGKGRGGCGGSGKLGSLGGSGGSRSGNAGLPVGRVPAESLSDLCEKLGRRNALLVMLPQMGRALGAVILALLWLASEHAVCSSDSPKARKHCTP